MGHMGLPTSSKISPPKVGVNDWKNIFYTGLFAGAFIFQWFLIRSGQVLLLIKNKYSESVNWSSFFSLTIVSSYFAFLMLNNHYIDRYNLLAIPFLIVLLAPYLQDFHVPKFFKFLAQLSLFIIIVFSIGTTHDYLSWNRARWKAVDYAHQELKIKPESLNGGFEYKFTYDIKHIRLHGWEDLETWNTSPEQYLLSFSKECSYETAKAYPYQRYFPPRTDSIYLLKKEFLTNFDTLTCDMENLTNDGKFFTTNQEDILLGNTNTIVSDIAFSGNHSVMVHKGDEYALTFKIKNVEPCEKISVSFNRFPSGHYAKGVMIYGDNFHMENLDYITWLDVGDWVKLNQEFKVPADFQDSTMTFYLYNPFEEKAWFDDMTIIRMK